MKVITWLDDAKEILGDSAVALGNFDGIHKGHQQLISKAVEISKEEKLSSVVFTFGNHPMNEIMGRTVVRSIMQLSEKAVVTEMLGVDYMVNARFDRFIMKLEPELFVKKILAGKLHVKHAVCGFNYSFGYKGEGTPEMLKEYGKKYGFKVTVIPEFKIDNQTVSSTFIRTLIEKGDMKSYEKFTGRTYKMSGYVMHGQKFGRTIGFPTANLNLSPSMALPLNGVYLTRTMIDGVNYCSITNVGNKPSVGEFEKNAESHIFNFSGDIYGSRVIVEFIDLLRPEIKFENTDALAKQIENDCRKAKDRFGIE